MHYPWETNVLLGKVRHDHLVHVVHVVHVVQDSKHRLIAHLAINRFYRYTTFDQPCHFINITSLCSISKLNFFKLKL